MASANRARQAFGTRPHGDAPPTAQATAPWPQTGGLLRVLVVSEIRLFQDALAALLGDQAGVCVVGATNPLQASAQTSELRPDIVLFDATRAGNLGYARALADQVPAAKVVAFGVAETDAEIVALAAAGIAGYVRDDAAAEDVVAVLKSAMRDELLCSPRAAATLCHHVAVLSRDGHGGPPTKSPAPALSKRELQIGDLIDRGLSNKQIARQLGIQATTVKNHVHNIFDKLKVHRRGEAAACLRTALRRTDSSLPDRAHQGAEITPRDAGS
jgi:two-component system, NarL family, nitrate/nitrite response regulator NarL